MDKKIVKKDVYITSKLSIKIYSIKIQQIKKTYISDYNYQESVLITCGLDITNLKVLRCSSKISATLALPSAVSSDSVKTSNMVKSPPLLQT